MIIVVITCTIIANLMADIDIHTWSKPMVYFIWGATINLVGNQALVVGGSYR